MELRPYQSQSQFVGLHKEVTLLRIAPAPKVIIAGDNRTIGDSRVKATAEATVEATAKRHQKRQWVLSGSDRAAHQAKGACCEDCEPLLTPKSA